MYNVLLSQFNFDEDWCYQAISEYLTPTDCVAVLPLTFKQEVDTSEKWQQLYGVGNEYYEMITKPFQRFGYDVAKFIWINPFEMTRDEIVEIFEQTDLLVLPGGLPDLQMQRMNDLDLVDELRNYYGNVLGVSSGAVTQPPTFYLPVDADYPKAQYGFSGVGMIDINAQIEVHFDFANSSQQQALSHVRKTDNVIAIGEEGCLIVDHDHIQSVGNVWYFKKE